MNHHYYDIESIKSEEEIPINDKLREIKSIKRLLRTEYDIESPRFKKSMIDLGIEADDIIIRYH